VAFGQQSPHSYSVYGKADWHITFNGAVTSTILGYIWSPSNGAGAASSGFMTNGYPQPARAVGVEVNGPVGLRLITKDGTQ
jgi:hypothetical protein